MAIDEAHPANYTATLGTMREAMPRRIEHLRCLVNGDNPSTEWARAISKVRNLIAAELSRDSEPARPSAQSSSNDRGLMPNHLHLPRDLEERLRTDRTDSSFWIAVHNALRRVGGPQITQCICFGDLPGDITSVIDWRKIKTPLPHVYAYALKEDVLAVHVSDAPGLSSNQMLVGLQLRHPLTWGKEVHGWNFCTQTKTSTVFAGDRNRGPNWMWLERSDCHSGTDTVVLAKAKMFGIMTGMYHLKIPCFWQVWGGKRVLFEWVKDDGGSGKTGEASDCSVCC